MQEPNSVILVADIGGTKSVFGVASGVELPLALGAVQTYSSRDFSSFDALLDTYLASTQTTPRQAVIAVAGRVTDGRASITNRSWQVNALATQERYGFERVALLNDVEAMAWSIPFVSPDDIEVLLDGHETSGGSIALLAPGTGLGVAFLTWNGTAYAVHATEGGHADFAPSNDEQTRLLTYLRDKLGHVSVERVSSGLGIANIYQFLRQDSSEPESPAIQAKLAAAEDVTPVIIAAALSKESPICEHAVRLFAESIAAEAGSFALRVNATGGIYLGGGLSIHLLPYLRSDAFAERFLDKGRFSNFLQQVPLYALRDPLSVLRGAALMSSRGFAREGRQCD